jgi:hypothetical protein
MSSMLTTTCPLCGLRFPGRPLLDLHMREDHRERNRPAEPGHDDSGDTGPPGDGGGGPSGGDAGLAPGEAGTAHEEVAATMTRQRPRSGRAMAALRRAIGIRRSPAPADRDAQPASPVGRADRSA